MFIVLNGPMKEPNAYGPFDSAEDADAFAMREGFSIWLTTNVNDPMNGRVD